MYYIYRITNKVNGKTYIGQHKYKELNDNYMGSGKRLWEAYRKYGLENFEKQILVSNISKGEHADLLEKTFIASEREKVGIRNCYNIADGGNGNKGHHPSDEAKKKMGNAMRGKHHTEEAKKRISYAVRNRSEEIRRKIAESHKGKHHTEETRKKISKNNKGMKGKHHSEETRKKISEAHKGKSSSCKGKHWKLVDGKRVWY